MMEMVSRVRALLRRTARQSEDVEQDLLSVEPLKL